MPVRAISGRRPGARYRSAPAISDGLDLPGLAGGAGLGVPVPAVPVYPPPLWVTVWRPPIGDEMDPVWPYRLAVVVLASMALASCSSTSRSASEPPQIRTVLGQSAEPGSPPPTSATGCSATNINNVPVADRSVTLLAPNAPPPGPCLRLGPALLSIARVRSVETGKSPAGLVGVIIRLAPSDVPRFDAVVRQSGTAYLAFVILGQVLSIPTANPELTQPAALAGNIQVAGGMSPTDPRPGEIANALGAKVVQLPTPSCPKGSLCNGFGGYG